MRAFACLLLLVAGCIEPNGGIVAPQPPKTITGEIDAEIEAATYDASQKRDEIGSKLLNSLADEIKAKRTNGETVHDAWVQQRITEANTAAVRDGGRSLSELLAKKLNPGGTLDSQAAEKTIRGMAAGKLRASK